MNTTRSMRMMRRLCTTCSTISSTLKWRSTPNNPDAQKRHPTAQPTCVETQQAPIGIATVSTFLPSRSSSSSFTVPSAARVWVATRVTSPAASHTSSARCSSGARRSPCWSKSRVVGVRPAATRRRASKAFAAGRASISPERPEAAGLAGGVDTREDRRRIARRSHRRFRDDASRGRAQRRNPERESGVRPG